MSPPSPDFQVIKVIFAELSSFSIFFLTKKNRKTRHFEKNNNIRNMAKITLIT